MNRVLTGHQVNPVNDLLDVIVMDEPGAGGANHHYSIVGFRLPDGLIGRLDVKFQNGPINVAGVNGVTHEALLAILIDRLWGFQRGQYASDDNEQALTHLNYAQEALQRRTKARMARGVEGTLVV